MLDIYDCTLREGEQAAGAHFNFQNRVELAQKLDDFGVDYIELGWPLSSQEIFDCFQVCNNKVKNAKIVAFGSTSITNNITEDKNLNSIVDCGAKYACIFGKTWLEHIEKQLRLTSEENLKKIKESVEFLKKAGIKVFYDAEHFFEGFKSNKEYAVETLVSAAQAGAEKLILCDTNGAIFPHEVKAIIEEVKEILNKKNIKAGLGVHFHNDRGLALANTLSCLPYIEHVQGTLNGIGERIGNLDLCTFLPCYELLGKKPRVNLEKLKELSEESARLSGFQIVDDKPFVGKNAFAHKGGVHNDALSKGASYEHVVPEKYGNKRKILLTRLGGSASVVSVAKQFGHELDKKDPKTKEKMHKLFEELSSLESQGYRLSALPAEQFLLIEKHFSNAKEFFSIKDWKITTEKRNKSKFWLRCLINGSIIEDELIVDGGPVDAAYKLMKKLLEKTYSEIQHLHLLDYHVEIARRNEEASSVRTAITFKDSEKFETIGVSQNIIESSIEALSKGFQYYLQRLYSRRGKI